MDVAAVIIARNEEGVIARSIESVLLALERGIAAGLFRSQEVWLVDSASTDRTVEIARRFPISIARLRTGWRLSAAAGRATGARLASGRVLLFVDGDYVLDADWLLHAWRILEQPRVGGVIGWDLDEVGGDTVIARRWREVRPEDLPEGGPADTIAVGLIRREAYDSVGGIHPFLRGAEDRDLGMRLLAAGWRIVRTREHMGVHVWAEEGRSFTYLEYYRSVAIWSAGDGQVCRVRWRNRAFRRRLLGRYATMRFLIQDLQFLGAAGLILANLSGLVLGPLYLLFAGALDAGFLGTLDALRRRRRRSWPEALYEMHGLFYGPYRQAWFLLGLLTRTPPPDTYPNDVEIVARAGA